MTMWLAILLVGLGTYTFRVVPCSGTESVCPTRRTPYSVTHQRAR